MFHALGRVVVAVPHYVIEYPGRAMNQGNVEHFKGTLKWLVDTILKLATDVKSFSNRAAWIDTE
jgi:hypothetical protein